MKAREFARSIGLGVLLAADISQAENAAHLGALEGTQIVVAPAGEPGTRQEPPSPAGAIPQGPVPPPATTPFGSPSPPNQLTPAPVLPFHPHGPLMPSVSQPAPSSGSGRLGR